MTDHTAQLVLLVFVAVALVAGKGGTLAKLPLVVAGALLELVLKLASWLGRVAVRALARWLGFGWPQWCWLGVTVVVVAQASRSGVPPRSAWTAAGFAWGAWLAVHLHAVHRWRTAPKRHAKAMHKHAQTLQEQAKTGPAASSARQTRRAAHAATKAARPAPDAQPRPITVTQPPAPPPQPAPYWTPPPTGLDPVLPSWLGGGLLRRLRGRG